MEKRIRARAIIIHEGKIVSKYRERENMIFYTFPGGGMEGDETEGWGLESLHSHQFFLIL